MMVYAYYGLIFVWVFFEVFLSLLIRSSKGKDLSFDKGSIRLIWLVIVLSVFLGVYTGVRWGYKSMPWLVAGTLVIALGILLRVVAILSLRKAFTTDIAIRESHELKTDGLYSRIRHPSYLGSIISFLGLGISTGNWVSVLLLLLPITGIFLYRISLEEKMLLQHFGETYAAYRSRTKRLFPYIY